MYSVRNKGRVGEGGGKRSLLHRFRLLNFGGLNWDFFFYNLNYVTWKLWNCVKRMEMAPYPIGTESSFQPFVCFLTSKNLYVKFKL